jgi:hypothetical protein
MDSDGNTRMKPRNRRKNHAKEATVTVLSTTRGKKTPHVYG